MVHAVKREREREREVEGGLSGQLHVHKKEGREELVPSSLL